LRIIEQKLTKEKEEKEEVIVALWSEGTAPGLYFDGGGVP